MSFWKIGWIVEDMSPAPWSSGVKDGERDDDDDDERAE